MSKWEDTGKPRMPEWVRNDKFQACWWCKEREQEDRARLIGWLLAFGLPIGVLLWWLDYMGVI